MPTEFGDLGIWVQAGLFVASAAAAVFAYRQARQAGRQAEASRIQAEAAKRQATATEEMVDVARRHADAAEDHVAVARDMLTQQMTPTVKIQPPGRLIVTFKKGHPRQCARFTIINRSSAPISLDEPPFASIVDCEPPAMRDLIRAETQEIGPGTSHLNGRPIPTRAEGEPPYFIESSLKFPVDIIVCGDSREAIQGNLARIQEARPKAKVAVSINFHYAGQAQTYAESHSLELR